MSSEPGWEAGDIRPPERVWPPSGRTAAQEQLLTDFARNYEMGRRWLCRLAHAIAWLGFVLGAFAAGWDQITAGVERLGRMFHGQ